MKKIILSVLSLFMCLCLCACTGEISAVVVNRDGQTENLSSKELIKIKEENPVAFEEKYYEADVTVISKIQKIHGRTILNSHEMNAYLELEGGWVVEAATADEVSDLSVGDEVEITGKIWSIFADNIHIFRINGHTTTINKRG